MARQDNAVVEWVRTEVRRLIDADKAKRARLGRGRRRYDGSQMERILRQHFGNLTHKGHPAEDVYARLRHLTDTVSGDNEPVMEELYGNGPAITALAKRYNIPHTDAAVLRQLYISIAFSTLHLSS